MGAAAYLLFAKLTSSLHRLLASKSKKVCQRGPVQVKPRCVGSV